MPNPDSNLADLMERYLAGEAAAFRALYQATSPFLHRFLLERSGGDATRANQLLEQTFLAIHRSRAHYVTGADPLPWFCAIAQCCCQSATRAPSSRRNAGVELHPY